MPEPDPRTGPRDEPERINERAADPAETADGPLQAKSAHGELSSSDEPGGQPPAARDPHHVLNNPVGEPDPIADSDPYGASTDEDEQDRASGARGSGQGAEDR